MKEKDSRASCIPVLYASESECCGCGACRSVCPRDAISMQPDRYGFLYPRIDGDLCVRCGMCLRVCEFKKDMKRQCAGTRERKG